MRPWVPALLLAAACTDGTVPTAVDTSDPTDAACPEGMTRASSASAVITNLLVDGILYTVGVDAGLTYGGIAGACLSADGTASQVVLDSAGAVLGILSQAAPEAGSYDPNGSIGTLTFDLSGAPTPFTVGPGDWVTGTWTVDSVGATQSYSVQAEATTGGNTLAVSLFVDVIR